MEFGFEARDGLDHFLELVCECCDDVEQLFVGVVVWGLGCWGDVEEIEDLYVLGLDYLLGLELEFHLFHHLLIILYARLHDLNNLLLLLQLLPQQPRVPNRHSLLHSQFLLTNRLRIDLDINKHSLHFPTLGRRGLALHMGSHQLPFQAVQLSELA